MGTLEDARPIVKASIPAFNDYVFATHLGDAVKMGKEPFMTVGSITDRDSEVPTILVVLPATAVVSTRREAPLPGSLSDSFDAEDLDTGSNTGAEDETGSPIITRRPIPPNKVQGTTQRSHLGMGNPPVLPALRQPAKIFLPAHASLPMTSL